MRPALAATTLLCTLLAAPVADATFNDPRSFEASYSYMPGLSGEGPITVVSGKVDATLPGGPGSHGFFESQGATLRGLRQVCYGSTCTADDASRPYQLVVPPGGSFALCFPTPAPGRFVAGHALAVFADLTQDENLNTFPVDRSLVAPSIDGEFTFTTIATIDAGITVQSLSRPCSLQGGLSALDDSTQVQLRRGAQTLTTLTGKEARFAYTGQPTVDPVQAAFFVLPFSAGARADFEPAARSDAREGLVLSRVNDLVGKLDDAHAGSTVDRTEAGAGGDDAAPFLAGLLNGALVRGEQTAQAGIDLRDATFVRFSTFQVRGQGNGLAWEGRAYLAFEEGDVDGAKPLVGVWLLHLPWWSYVLWAAAIGLAITRLVLKPVKDHPRWDRLRWIGWVATPLAWLLVFLLFDLEMHAVFGASLLRGSFVQFRLVVALLQLALLGFIGLAASAPLRVLARNGFLLARQGTFMGLAGCIAAVLGFLLAVTYVRGYLEVLLRLVMANLPA